MEVPLSKIFHDIEWKATSRCSQIHFTGHSYIKTKHGFSVIIFLITDTKIRFKRATDEQLHP